MYNSVKYIKWVCNNSAKYTCKAWTPSAWSQTGNYYDWNCLGQNGWSTASCKIWNPQPINGKCGIAKWRCTVGTAIGQTQKWNNYDWSCRGEYGWNTASCRLPSPQYISRCNNASKVWKKSISWKVCEQVMVTDQKDCVMVEKDPVEWQRDPIIRHYKYRCNDGYIRKRSKKVNGNGQSYQTYTNINLPGTRIKYRYVWLKQVYKFQ